MSASTPAVLGEGLSYAEIAARLVVSLNTVRFRIKEIYGKLGVNRQAPAVAQTQELGLLSARHNHFFCANGLHDRVVRYCL